MAGDQMVVDHADRLHEGIDDGRPDELEAAADKLLRHLARQRRSPPAPAWSSRNVLSFGLPSRKSHSSAEKPGPFSMIFEIGARRADRALDLGAVAHDAGVLHQPLDLLRRVARDLLRLEIVEGAAEIVALAQDGDPRQPGLEAVEHQLLVERAVVVFRHAPFLVVIGDVERVLLRPGAALEAVGMENGRAHDAACVSPGQANVAQSGFTSADGDAAGGERRAGGERIGDAVEAQQGEAAAVRGRAERADLLVARHHRQCRASARTRHRRSAPRGCARWRDARRATPPPGRHSSPCRNRRRRAGPCRLRAGRCRHR